MVGLAVTHRSRDPDLAAMIPTARPLLVVFGHINDKTAEIMDAKGSGLAVRRTNPDERTAETAGEHVGSRLEPHDAQDCHPALVLKDQVHDEALAVRTERHDAHVSVRRSRLYA